MDHLVWQSIEKECCMLVILVIREFNCLAKSICTYPLSIAPLFLLFVFYSLYLCCVISGLVNASLE